MGQEGENQLNNKSSEEEECFKPFTS